MPDLNLLGSINVTDSLLSNQRFLNSLAAVVGRPSNTPMERGGNAFQLLYHFTHCHQHLASAQCISSSFIRRMQRLLQTLMRKY
jgi:hypothetical protein